MIEQHEPHYKPMVNTGAPEQTPFFRILKQMYIYGQHLLFWQDLWENSKSTPDLRLTYSSLTVIKLSSTPKLSNQNDVFIGYDILIGYFQNS